MKSLTLANIVTLSRLLFLVPAIYFLISGQRSIAIGFLAIVLIGDLADGAIARMRNEVSELGKILDPIVDKIVFFSIFIALAILGEMPTLAFLLLLIFQIGIIIGAILQYKREGQIEGARPLGKIASLALSAGLVGMILQIEWAIWVLYGGIAAGFIAGLDYLLIASRRLRSPRPATPPPDTDQPQGEERQ